ncbi:MAG: TonB-dependent receptor [Proteobacteria bacterium]|nr:TonB-dependent receptor [Pseudomonadota bacterium]
MRKIMAGVGATLVALTSHAENTPSSQKADSGQLEEITVTAERRVESVADVPISVTVFNAATIEKLHFQDAQDFMSQTPNVSFQQTGLNGARQIIVTMRGISDIKSGEKIDTVSAFSTYVDEFGLGTQASGQANPSAYDVQSIEVLLGPQGTFFGRNSEGGAINITTRRPDKDFYGQIDVGGGNFGTYELDGIVNIPVTDTLFVRETIETSKTQGFVRNRNPTGGGSQARFLNSRTQLRWQPTEATTVDLSLTRTVDDQDYPNMVPTCIKPSFGNNPIKNPAVLGGIGCYDPNDSIETLLKSAASDPSLARYLPKGLAPGFTKNSGDSIYQNSAAYTNNSSTLAVAKLEQDFSNFSVTSITGQIQSYQSAYQDLDQSGIDSIDRKNGYSARDWSEELRIASLGHRTVDWTLGALYYNDKFYAGNAIIIKDFAGSWIRGDNANENNIFAGRSGYGVFGNATWNVTPEWALILGGRYGHDKSEQQWSNVYAACDSIMLGQPRQPGCELRPDQVALTPVQQAPDGTLWTTGGRQAQTLGTYASNQSSVFTPRVALRWKPSDAWSAYLTWSEGYKPAGAEANPDSGYNHISNFGPEKMRNYEVGFNGRLWDNRVSVDGAIFRMDWTNMQVEVDQSYCLVGGVLVPTEDFQSTTCKIIPLNGVQNARKARSQGMELASQALVGSHWHFGASAGLLDAKFIEYVQDNAGTLVDFAGRRLPNAPRWTVSGFGEYNMPIGASADAFLRADVNYRGSVSVDTASAVVAPWPAEIPGYTIANLTLGLNYANQSVSFQVKNLFDRQYYTGTEGFSYGGTVVDVNPRTFFVRWTWKTR